MSNKSLLERRLSRLEKLVNEEFGDPIGNVREHIKNICDDHNLWEDAVYAMSPALDDEDLYDVCVRLAKSDSRFKPLLDEFEQD